MTFDFTPRWLERAAPDETVSSLPPAARLSPLAAVPCAPTHPDQRQLAELVRELFAEGTLSWEQLRSLATLPELRLLLEDAMAGVPAGRRLTLPVR